MEVIFLNEDLVKQAHPAADMAKHMAVPENDVVIPELYPKFHGENMEGYDHSPMSGHPCPRSSNHSLILFWDELLYFERWIHQRKLYKVISITDPF
jgi:hypothetical protein